jgi:hypothetical protein
MSLLLGLATAAWPCGGLTHHEEALAESDSLVSVFELSSDRVAVTYEVTYVGNAEDIGWVIPVPAEVLEVADGQAVLLDELLGASAPIVSYPVIETEEKRGCRVALASGGSKDAGNSQDSEFVEVEAEGFTGTYDYVVVRANEPEALAAWFEQNGWEGLPQDNLAHYVELGSHFVGIRVVPDSALTPAEGRQLPPVRIEYEGSELRFPAVMARHLGAAPQRSTLFVLADQRATIESGWAHEDLTDLDGADANTAFEDALSEFGASRTFARIWANQHDDYFATRFDTIAPRELHDADVVFAVADGTDSMRLYIDQSSSSGSAVLLLLPLLGLPLLRRRAPTAA